MFGGRRRASRTARAQTAQISAGRVRGTVARSATEAGRGQICHTEGVGGAAAVGLREQRAGVRERDITSFVVVPEAKAPETQASVNAFILRRLLYPYAIFTRSDVHQRLNGRPFGR